MQISAVATITVRNKLMAISYSESERRLIARWIEGVSGEVRQPFHLHGGTSIFPRRHSGLNHARKPAIALHNAMAAMRSVADICPMLRAL